MHKVEKDRSKETQNQPASGKNNTMSRGKNMLHGMGCGKKLVSVFG